MQDFLNALDEVKPAFGANTESLSTYVMHGMINYGDVYHHLRATLEALVKQVCDRRPGTCSGLCLLQQPSTHSARLRAAGQHQ